MPVEGFYRAFISKYDMSRQDIPPVFIVKNKINYPKGKIIYETWISLGSPNRHIVHHYTRQRLQKNKMVIQNQMRTYMFTVCRIFYVKKNHIILNI
jgi:hypothetical protein